MRLLLCILITGCSTTATVAPPPTAVTPTTTAATCTGAEPAPVEIKIVEKPAKRLWDRPDACH